MDLKSIDLTIFETNEIIERLKNEITETGYSEYLKIELKNRLLGEHSESIVDKVLEHFKIKVYDPTQKEIQRTSLYTKSTEQCGKSYWNIKGP